MKTVYKNPNLSKLQSSHQKNNWFDCKLSCLFIQETIKVLRNNERITKERCKNPMQQVVIYKMSRQCSWEGWGISVQHNFKSLKDYLWMVNPTGNIRDN